jgi:hypothetical protein
MTLQIWLTDLGLELGLPGANNLPPHFNSKSFIKSHSITFADPDTATLFAEVFEATVALEEKDVQSLALNRLFELFEILEPGRSSIGLS